MRFLRWLRREPTFAQHYAGTLTLLADGTVIVGLPEDSSQKMAHEVELALQAWNEHGRKSLLVFPWPVEVRDLRVAA